MSGRTEDKIKAERRMQNKVFNLPNYMVDYYYSLNEKTHMTKERYIDHTIRFLNFYGDGDINNVSEDDLKNITALDINKYIMSVQFIGNNRELSPEGKALIYSSINSFLTFLKKHDKIINNPFDNKGIERPKTKDHDIVFLEPEEYAIVKRNIMSGVGNSRAKAKQKDWMYRDLLLFQLPIITGVRVTALSQISLDDIDFNNHTIKVIDKARDKTLYLDNETFGMLLVWMENRKQLIEGYQDCPYLFISNQRRKMDVKSIRRVVNKYTECLDKHISPHKLRSTCGTNMYRATGDIYLVADVLGHASPATSRKYTKIATEGRVNASELLAQRMKSK